MPIDEALEGLEPMKPEDKEGKQSGVTAVRVVGEEKALEDYIVTNMKGNRSGSFVVFHPWLRFKQGMRPTFIIPRGAFVEALVSAPYEELKELGRFVKETFVGGSLEETIRLPLTYEKKLTDSDIFNDAFQSRIDLELLQRFSREGFVTLPFSFAGLMIEHGREFFEILNAVEAEKKAPCAVRRVVLLAPFYENRPGGYNQQFGGYKKEEDVQELFQFKGGELLGLLAYAKKQGEKKVGRVVRDLQQLNRFFDSLPLLKPEEEKYQKVVAAVFERLQKYSPHVTVDG